MLPSTLRQACRKPRSEGPAGPNNTRGSRPGFAPSRDPHIQAGKRGQAPHLSPSTDRAAAIGAGLARAYRVVSRRRRGIGAI